MRKLVISFPIEDEDRADRLEFLLGQMGKPPVKDLVRQLESEGIEPEVHVETDLTGQ